MLRGARALEYSGSQHADVAYVALLGERPGAELVPGDSTQHRHSTEEGHKTALNGRCILNAY